MLLAQRYSKLVNLLRGLCVGANHLLVRVAQLVDLRLGLRISRFSSIALLPLIFALGLFHSNFVADASGVVNFGLQLSSHTLRK